MNPGRFLGGLLLSLGLMIVWISGPCTVFVFAGTLLGGKGIGHQKLADVAGAELLPLIVGGVPFVIGAVLVKIGRRLTGGHPPDVYMPPPKDTETPSSQDDIERMNKDIE